MPRFQPGDSVRVPDLHKPGHVRIPFFVCHKTGVVERPIEESFPLVTRHMLVGRAVV